MANKIISIDCDLDALRQFLTPEQVQRIKDNPKTSIDDGLKKFINWFKNYR